MSWRGGYRLAGFGAKVIQVEVPGEGDPLRRRRKVVDGTSLWRRSMARDKQCITCHLRHPEGQALLRRLIRTPSVPERLGPALGADNEVFYAQLGLSPETDLRARVPTHGFAPAGRSPFGLVDWRRNRRPRQDPPFPALAVPFQRQEQHPRNNIIVGLLSRSRLRATGLPMRSRLDEPRGRPRLRSGDPRRNRA